MERYITISDKHKKAVPVGAVHLQMTDGKVHKKKSKPKHKRCKEEQPFTDDTDGFKNSEGHTKLEILNDSLENVCFNENSETDVSESKRRKKKRKRSLERELLLRDSRGNETSTHCDTEQDSFSSQNSTKKKKKKHHVKLAPDAVDIQNSPPNESVTLEHIIVKKKRRKKWKDSGSGDLPKALLQHEKKLEEEDLHYTWDIDKTCGMTSIDDDTDGSKNLHKKKKHRKHSKDHIKVENLNDSLENVCFNEKSIIDVSKSERHKKKRKHSLELLSGNENSSHYDTEQDSFSTQNSTKKKKKKHQVKMIPDAVDIQNSYPNESINWEHIIVKKRGNKWKDSGSFNSSEDSPKTSLPHKIKLEDTSYDQIQDYLDLVCVGHSKKEQPLTQDIDRTWDMTSIDDGSKNSEYRSKVENLNHSLQYDREQNSLNFTKKKKKKRDIQLAPVAVDIQDSHPNESADSEHIIKKGANKCKAQRSTNSTENNKEQPLIQDTDRACDMTSIDDGTDGSKNSEVHPKVENLNDSLENQKNSLEQELSSRDSCENEVVSSQHHVNMTPDSQPNESAISEHIVTKKRHGKRKDSESTDSTDDDLHKILLSHKIKVEDESDTTPRKKQHDIKLEALTDYDRLQDYLDLSSVRQRLKDNHKTMLRHLNISLPWQVPPTHLVETRMSSHPTKDQKKLFQELPTPMKTSHYTTIEDKIIQDNWKYFCKVHNLPTDPEPFLNFEANNDSKIEGSALPKLQRINFVRFLGHKLEHRYLYSIYRRFKKLYSVVKKGRFSEVEDTIILEYIQKSHDSNPFSTLACVLNRDRHRILMRYKTLNARLHGKDKL